MPRLYPAPEAATVRRTEADFYYRFCRRLAAIGLRRRADQTPAEFAQALAAHDEAFNEAPQLVRAYYDVVFGRRALSTERRARIAGFLDRLRRLEQARLSEILAGWNQR